MLRSETITNKIDFYKPIILGVFLGTQILGHAIGNIALSILFALFLISILAKKKIYFDKLLLPIILYFLWGVTSVFWTTSVPETLSGIGKTIGLLIIPLFISQQSKITTSDLKKTFDIFSYCLIIYFLISLLISGLLYFEDNDISHFFYHNLVSLFKNNAIYISLFTGICLLIKINQSEKNSFDLIIILFLSAFLLLLSSKNLIISTFIIGAVSKILSINKVRNSTKKTFISITIITGCFLALIFFDNPIKQRFLDETSLNIENVLTKDDFSEFEFSGTDLRIFQWRVVYEMTENNHIGFLGLGLDNINYLTEQYFSYYNVYEGYMPVNFHNQYLQTYGEIGVVGLFLLLYNFFYLGKKSFSEKDIMILTVSVLIFISFFTESYLSRQKGILLFAICYSILIRYKKKNI